MGPFKQEYMIETSLQLHAFWRHCGFFRNISNQDWKLNQNAVKDSYGEAPTEELPRKEIFTAIFSLHSPALFLRQ